MRSSKTKKAEPPQRLAVVDELLPQCRNPNEALIQAHKRLTAARDNVTFDAHERRSIDGKRPSKAAGEEIFPFFGK
jgi:hypothetical protein